MFVFLIFVLWFLGLLILLVFAGILIIYLVGGVCMAVFKEDQFLVPKNLYAVWYDEQVTMKDGVMTGAYIDVRLDQAGVNSNYDLMARADRGELYGNPSVNVTLDENRREVSESVWYSLDALNKIIEVSGSTPDSMELPDGRRMHIVSFSGELMHFPYDDNPENETVKVIVPPEGSKEFSKYGLSPSRYAFTDYVDYLESESVAEQVREYNEEKQNVKSAFDLTSEDLMSVSLLNSQYNDIRKEVQAKTGLKSSVDHDMSARFEHDKKFEFLGRARAMVMNNDVVPLYPGMCEYVNGLSDISHDGIMRVTLRKGPGLKRGDICVFEGKAADELFCDIRLGDTIDNDGGLVSYGEKAVRDRGYVYCFCDSHDLREQNERNGVYARERDDYMKAHDPVVVANKILADKQAILEAQARTNEYIAARERVTGDKSAVAKDPVVTDKKEIAKGSAVTDKQVASNCKYYRNQPLIAVWDLKDVRRNKDGTVKGAYVDMQVDQSGLTKDEVKSGRGFASPSVHFAYSKNPEQKPNKVFYTKRQLDDILSVGKVANAGSKTGVSFTGNVYTKTNENTCKQTSWVLTPKDPANAKTKEDMDNIAWYNRENALGKSFHEEFTSDTLKQHFANTRTIRSIQGKDVNPKFLEAVKSGGLESSGQYETTAFDNPDVD